MPGSTPIYGFPYPLDTDPVNEGAKHIRDNALKMEAQLSQLKFPPAGSDILTFSKRVTFLEEQHTFRIAPLTISATGWEQKASCYVNRIGPIVYTQGLVLNTTHVGGWTHIGTIPIGYRPSYTVTANVSGNTDANLALEFLSDGRIMAYSSKASAAWRNFSPLSGFITTNAMPAS